MLGEKKHKILPPALHCEVEYYLQRAEELWNMRNILLNLTLLDKDKEIHEKKSQKYKHKKIIHPADLAKSIQQ